MNHSEFVHLHNHTEYSLLDGACRVVDDKGAPGEFINTMAKYKMQSLAITDHGNMYGAIEFYQACMNAGIKPIIGCEVYIAPGSRFEKKAGFSDEKKTKQENYYHLVLLAKDQEGYENLLEIVSTGYLEGFYRKPRVDKETLGRLSKGLICLSACLKGELAQIALAGDNNRAKKIIEEYKSIFGRDNYYIELMDNGIDEQKKFLEAGLRLSKETNTPVVATNDCHYLHKEDAYNHDILLCIDTGVTVDTPNRLKFSTNEFYYKSPKEMIQLFSSIPEAIKNTLEIASRCSLNLNFDQLLLPYYEVPENEKTHAYLKKLCEQGLARRYGNVTAGIKERLEYELKVIENMGFSSYFLIVSDIVHYAKRNRIPVGPGRGSGAGSIVSYCLGITDICPIKYGLLFERFLNPERRTMPDLDIDFADFGREKIIEYVIEKYGKHNVAQIITFGTMQSRLVIRDVARALGLPLSEADKIAKLIPSGTSIYQAIKSVDELKGLYEKEDKYRKLIDIGHKLEGLKRHTSVHAAGIVIAKDKITKFTPLAKSSRGDQDIVTTQYNDEGLIKLGLLKIDILGLRTLTVLDNTIKYVYGDKKDEFSLSSLPLNDKNTFKLLQEAKTAGVFQLESSGMRDLLRKLKPTMLEDIIALNSLYRPGPIGSGMLDDFVKRKHQQTKVKYDHPLLEPILKETYGIILYQEQVMKIATDLAKFSGANADKLRKAMGKKIPEVIEKEHDNFVESARKNGIDKKIAEKVFELIVHFGGYGFNKSHAAAYGVLAYYTAYFKANYPVQYMCALLTSEIGRASTTKEEGNKLLNYINETKLMGINILPPDLQKSDTAFTIENGNIRFGLLAIKNVGELASENIVSERRKGGPFKSLPDFNSRTDSRQVNKKVVESLIKAGAFDFLGQYEKISSPSYVRAKATSELELLSSSKHSAASKQESLFEFRADESAAFEQWPDHVLLGNEKEVLGLYFSGHPLAQYREIINSVSSHKLDALPSDNTKITIAGMIANIKRLTTKAKGEQWAKFRVENFDGEIDILLFPKNYSNGMSKFLNMQAIVVIKGRISNSDDKPTIIAENIIPLDEYEKSHANSADKIFLNISSIGIDDKFITNLRKILVSNKGETRVVMNISSKTHDEILVETPYRIKISDKLLEEIRNTIGDNSWKIVS